MYVNIYREKFNQELTKLNDHTYKRHFEVLYICIKYCLKEQLSSEGKVSLHEINEPITT